MQEFVNILRFVITHPGHFLMWVSLLGSLVMANTILFSVKFWPKDRLHFSLLRFLAGGWLFLVGTANALEWGAIRLVPGLIGVSLIIALAGLLVTLISNKEKIDEDQAAPGRARIVWSVTGLFCFVGSVLFMILFYMNNY